MCLVTQKPTIQSNIDIVILFQIERCPPQKVYLIYSMVMRVHAGGHGFNPNPNERMFLSSHCPLDIEHCGFTFQFDISMWWEGIRCQLLSEDTERWAELEEVETDEYSAHRVYGLRKTTSPIFIQFSQQLCCDGRIFPERTTHCCGTKWSGPYLRVKREQSWVAEVEAGGESPLGAMSRLLGISRFIHALPHSSHLVLVLNRDGPLWLHNIAESTLRPEQKKDWAHMESK